MYFLRAVFRFRFIACIQRQTFSGRFVFLHLGTLPRSDFPGSHGAKKHYRQALFWARARQNFWCDFLQGKKVELFSLARFWRRKQKNLSLTLRAREKIWSRLVGKSNINRKRLLTFLNGAISWHNFCNMEQDSQTPRQKAVNTFCFLLPWKKKNFHVLEQSKQNIEMGIVKKTMNREYRNGRFLFEVFLLRYHEGVAIMDVILHYDQARPFRVSYFLSVRRNNLFPLYGFFKNFIWMSCFYHLSSLRCFSFRCLFAHWRPQRIPLLVLVVFPLPL